MIWDSRSKKATNFSGYHFFLLHPLLTCRGLHCSCCGMTEQNRYTNNRFINITTESTVRLPLAYPLLVSSISAPVVFSSPPGWWGVPLFSFESLLMCWLRLFRLPWTCCHSTSCWLSFFSTLLVITSYMYTQSHTHTFYKTVRHVVWEVLQLFTLTL